MRKRTVLGILCLASVLLPGVHVSAFTFEAHPGLSASYEYTDNYQGGIHNALSESIYYIGPSLALTCTSPSTNFDLTGRYSKSFHQRFPEDDSPDINLTTNASYTGPIQTARLSYEFARTLTRESLAEPFGEVIRNIASIAYSAELTRTTRMNAGGNFRTDKWSTEATTGEDLTNTGGNVGITHQISRTDTVSMSARRAYYRYEISPDVTGTQGSLDVRHVFTPLFSLGLGAVYNHDDRENDQNEDRYDATLTGQYNISRSATMNATGGYSWLIMEHQDRQAAYIARCTFDETLQDDRFHLSIAKEYTAEFTSNLYGTYDTRIASLSWERQWFQGWSSSMALAVSKRKVASGTPGQDQTDSNAHAALTWMPVEYFTGSIHYERHQIDYEISGTARENRYRMMIEVRY